MKLVMLKIIVKLSVSTWDLKIMISYVCLLYDNNKTGTSA